MESRLPFISFIPSTNLLKLSIMLETSTPNDVDLLETNEYSFLFIYAFSYAMFPVIMPQMKHESSLAPAMVATFADFPFLSSFAIFCFILFEPLSA